MLRGWKINQALLKKYIIGIVFMCYYTVYSFKSKFDTIQYLYNQYNNGVILSILTYCASLLLQQRTPSLTNTMIHWLAKLSHFCVMGYAKPRIVCSKTQKLLNVKANSAILNGMPTFLAF